MAVLHRFYCTCITNVYFFTETEDKDSIQITGGAKFCKALIGAYDQWILRKSDVGPATDRVHVITALKCLLAVSMSAKTMALESKFKPTMFVSKFSFATNDQKLL